MTECLCSPVRLLHRKVTAIYDEALRPHGVTSAQLNLLTAVGALRGRATATLLVAVMCMEKSTLSRELAALRHADLLDRQEVPNERAQGLVLTPRGRRLLDSLVDAWEGAQREARSLLDEEASAWLLSFARTERTRAPSVRARS